MIAAILPPQMTAEEQRGFRMACACFATWGNQLAAEPRLHGPAGTNAVRERFQKHGRVISAMACALDATLGRGHPIEALAEIATPN